MIRMPKTAGAGALPAGLLREMAATLGVLAHAERLRVVEFLDGAGAAPVHAIVAALGRPQAAVSRHLQRMRQVGLLRDERRGQEVWYRIANPHARTILDCLRRKARNP